MSRAGSVLQHSIDFSGRARRREFWPFIIVSLVVSQGTPALDHALGTPGTRPLEGYWTDWFSGGGLISDVAGLVVLVPTLAVCWRRMQDTGRPGKYTFIVLLAPLLAVLFLAAGPMVAIVAGSLPLIAFAALAAQDGTIGQNRFGPDPKDRQPRTAAGGPVSYPSRPAPPAAH